MMTWSGIKAGLLMTAAGWLFIAAATNLRAMLPPGAFLAYNVLESTRSEIYLLDVANGLTFNLTRSRVNASEPVWSPDGRYIAFEGREPGGSSIFVIDAFQGDLRRLTSEHEGNQYTPVWVDDGAGLYFRHVPGLGDRLVYRVSIDGSGLESVNVTSYRSLRAYSAALERPIFAGYHRGQTGIFLVKEGRQLEMLVPSNIVFNALPEWSPDGEYIGMISQNQGITEIFVVSEHGDDFRQVTQDGLLKSNLAWRP